ncbi:MAG TPA: hypothetical protein VM326_04565 [Sphingomicrobium sp.]|jgi:hypothetical protein|nr:hypothetical protein [Sphingomicrobium sp.]
MKDSAWIAGALLLAACSAPGKDAVPGENLVNFIEEKLAQHPCVGDLEEWERNYRFAKHTGLSAYRSPTNRDVIEFHLRRAGTFVIRPGRNIMPRGAEDDWPDGKSVHFLAGRYHIGAHQMYLSRCSPRNAR